MISPESCSNQCSIQVVQGNPVCNNNGTGGNPNDDTFTISVTLTGFNTGTGWTATWNGGSASGAYNTAVVLGPFATNTNFQIVFEDNGPSNCSTTLNIPAVAPCSDDCEINATFVTEPVCNNNGTPSNPNDDTYTFSVNVTGFNTGSTWTATWNGNSSQTGNYGANTVFGPFSIANGPIMFTFRDSNDPTCQDILMVVPPPTCSNVCEIVATQPETPRCDDNNTPADASDDVFYYTLAVNGFNTSGNWIATLANGQQVAAGAMGSTVTIGPLPIGNGLPFDVNIRDAANANCFTQISVTPPATCSDQCLVQLQYLFSSCFDNDTPYDPSDDQYYVGVQVTGFNTNGFWTTDDPTVGGPGFNGTYGAIIAFGPYPISGGDVTIRVWDVGDPACGASISAPAPQTCSDQCLVEEAVTNIRCEDNGTPTDPSDDVFYFDVTMTGVYNFSPLGWQQVFPNGTFGLSGQYGVTTTFGPYPISGGPRISASVTAEITPAAWTSR